MTTGVGASAGLRNDAIVAFGRLSIAARYEGPKGRVEHKKKARRNSDAPSNKTYGNCLLGLHCSQKHPAEVRAIARFLVVAGRQHRNPSTGYPQKHVDGLGIVSTPFARCQIGR